jgi:hypothetical protein
MISLASSILKAIIVLLLSIQNNPNIDNVSRQNTIQLANQAIIYVKQILDTNNSANVSNSNTAQNQSSSSSSNGGSVQTAVWTENSQPVDVITTAPPIHLGIIKGTITSSPSCPVQRIDTLCPPRPVAGRKVSVYAKISRALVATTNSDDSGNYKVSLPSGSYDVDVSLPLGDEETLGGSVLPKSVDISLNQTIEVNFEIDSGIR